MTRLIVVGGGVAGVSAAWHAVHDGPSGTEVVLLDAETRLGGKIRTEVVDGEPFDVGADAWLSIHPWFRDWVERLGLGDRIVAARTSDVVLWIDGRLRKLPPGTVLGFPTAILPLLRSGVLSRRGLARAAMEPLLPRRDDPDADVGLGRFVARRFGHEVADRLVDPLLSGVYAGDANLLSLHAAARPVADAAADRGSLLLALRRRRTKAATVAFGQPVAGQPGFRTVRGGLGSVVDRAVEGLGPGAQVRTSAAATRLSRDGDGWRVHLDDGTEVVGDRVILATPGPVTAGLLRDVSPRAVEELGDIRYACAVVIAMSFPSGTTLPAGSGMLVPRTEGRFLKAATWSSQKWPHVAERDGVHLRCSAGRIDDATALDLDDDEVVARALEDLRDAVGLTTAPTFTRVVRWRDALPQYEVGHLDRVARIRAALAEDAPGLAVAGAAYDGVGLPACTKSGLDAAALLLA